MSDLNRVFLIGNLVQDPELKSLKSGSNVVNFTIASNRYWSGPEGQKSEEVSYLDCSAFGRTAEVINKYFSKGRKIFIEGRLRQEKWEDTNTKKMQSKIRVIVDSFNFMDSKKDNNESSKSECIPVEAGNDAVDDFDTLL